MDKKLTIKDLPEWNETRTNPLEEFIYQWDCVSDKGAEFLPTLIDMINYVRSDKFKPRENPPVLTWTKNELEAIKAMLMEAEWDVEECPDSGHDLFKVCLYEKILAISISEPDESASCKQA